VGRGCRTVLVFRTLGSSLRSVLLLLARRWRHLRTILVPLGLLPVFRRTSCLFRFCTRCLCRTTGFRPHVRVLPLLLLRCLFRPIAWPRCCAVVFRLPIVFRLRSPIVLERCRTILDSARAFVFRRTGTIVFRCGRTVLRGARTRNGPVIFRTVVFWTVIFRSARTRGSIGIVARTILHAS